MFNVLCVVCADLRVEFLKYYCTTSFCVLVVEVCIDDYFTLSVSILYKNMKMCAVPKSDSSMWNMMSKLLDSSKTQEFDISEQLWIRCSSFYCLSLDWCVSSYFFVFTNSYLAQLSNWLIRSGSDNNGSCNEFPSWLQLSFIPLCAVSLIHPSFRPNYRLLSPSF